MKNKVLIIIGVVAVIVIGLVIVLMTRQAGPRGPQITADITPVKIYYDNGNLKAVRYFEDDKLAGPYKTYYENGQIRTEGNYVDGKMNGTFRRYYENGAIKTKEEYKNNVLIKSIRYDKSGNIIAQ